MTRGDFINWFEERFALTKNDIYEFGQLYDEVTKPQWISVGDELPEVGVAVLTITPRGTQRVGFYEDGWWLANYIDLVRMGSITHWMPLPQPPKKGGEE